MKKLKEIFIVFTCLLMWVLLVGGWSDTLKTNTPAGTDDPREADDRMREIKAAFVERLDIDHYFEASATSTYDHADTGKHRQVTFQSSISTPTQVTDEAHLYMQADDLWYQNDTDSTIQLTNDGEIEYQSISDVNSNTYIVSVDNAGTGTANLIKADANDLATLPDGAVLASATASGDGDRTIADKGYVDDQKLDMNDIFGSWTTRDSVSDGLDKERTYKVGSDGFVCVYDLAGENRAIKILTDNSNPPTTVRIGVTSYGGTNANGTMCPVKKDDYWKVISDATLTRISWLPIGSGTCVKQ